MEDEELKLSIKDRFLLSPVGQWVVLHRNLLLNIGTVVLVIIAWGVIKMTRTPHVDALRVAQEAFASWKEKPDDEALYQIFEKSFANAPEVKRMLCGDIAESLLILGRADDAAIAMAEPLKELRAIAPQYAEFSEISLLIARKSYQEALEKSVSFKERLSDQTPLYQQNLIRIACLQQKLNNAAGELAAWRDLAQSGLMDRQAAMGLSIKHSNASPLYFSSYVNERKTLLEQAVR